MNNKYEPKIVIDPFSLLVVNTKGELRRIYCPFLVRCIFPIDILEINQSYIVDLVKNDRNELIIYAIDGMPYIYNYFEIV